MYTTSISPYPEVGKFLSESSIIHEDFSQVKEIPTFRHYPKRIPVKIILNEDEEVPTFENNSETTEENSMYQFSPFNWVKSKSN
jgi:hypothetical protein